MKKPTIVFTHSLLTQHEPQKHFLNNVIEGGVLEGNMPIPKLGILQKRVFK